MSPTARTLQFLRKLGYTVAVVETWNAFTQTRKDLWNIADIIGIHPIKREFLLCQVTSDSNVSTRVRKVQKMPELLTWLQTGGRFEVHGWKKVGAKWHPRIVELTEETAAAEVVLPRRRRGREAAQGLLWGE